LEEIVLILLVIFDQIGALFLLCIRISLLAIFEVEAE